MIVKSGSKYEVKGESGRKMGSYASEAEAKKRLAQIEAFKAMKAAGTLRNK